MSGRLVLILLVLVTIVSVIGLTYPWVPEYGTSSYSTESTATAVNPEFLLDYSTSTITCTGAAPVWFEQVYPYTRTETWSAQTTLMVLVLSTFTSYVAYANNTQGKIALSLGFIILVGVIIVSARRRSHSDSR